MEGDHIKIRHWLTPLSWLYGLGVMIRNILFDCGVLRSERFDIPVISVGNITVGGTGKTPHTEHLIRLLSPTRQVAVLSRGYKRQSRGYRLATADMTMRDIGDEPFQMKHKYPQIHMAVDKNRCEGIRRLCGADVHPATEVILLDDAFQHRYVVPGINILLMDYHRLIYFDQLLPAGQLREPQSASQRADIVIVTKCPTNITPMEEHGIARSLEMQPWQKLFFTTFRYTRLRHFISGDEMPLDELQSRRYNVVLLTGIASPQQMEYDLRKLCNFIPIHFPDHHNFSRKDLQLLEDTVRDVSLNARPTLVITTEKDAARLADLQHEGTLNKVLSEKTLRSIYLLPVEIDFLDGQTKAFNQIILDYVRKHSRNGTLLKGKHARTS